MAVARVSTRTRIDSRRRWFPDVREALRYKHLAVLLGRRDITTRYRQTLLGTIWIFAGPLTSAGLFSFVFGGVAGLPSNGVPYFVFSYAGLLVWNLFSGALSGGSTSMVGNSSLITKIYFPRLVVPFSTLASTLLNTAISFCVMLLLLFVSGVGVSPQIVTLPIWFLLAIVLAMGLALGLTALSVLYRDVNYLTPLLTQLLLFLSPIAYSVQAVPARFRTLYFLNPLASIAEGTRWSLLGKGSHLPPAWALAYTVVFSIVVLLGGAMLFARREGSFADVI